MLGDDRAESRNRARCRPAAPPRQIETETKPETNSRPDRRVPLQVNERGGASARRRRFASDVKALAAAQTIP
jgi:hypothetical protein